MHTSRHVGVLPAGARASPNGRPPAGLAGRASGVAISLVSPSQLWREGLLALLVAHLDLQLVGSYPRVFPSAALLPNPPGHLVLLDGGAGHEPALIWTRHWRALTPPALVVVLDVANEVDHILACIAAGAAGYTLLGDGAADVIDAIQQVRQGVAHCSPEVTARLFAQVAAGGAVPAPDPDPPMPLTPRELAVLRYIAQDFSNQEIAVTLVIELSTVKHHVHNILEKLKLHHRWDAARLATAQGWLEVGQDTSLHRA